MRIVTHKFDQSMVQFGYEEKFDGGTVNHTNVFINTNTFKKFIKGDIFNYFIYASIAVNGPGLSPELACALSGSHKCITDMGKSACSLAESSG